MEGFFSTESKERSATSIQQPSAFRAGSGAFCQITSLHGSPLRDIRSMEQTFS
jgi:hypothetical protein